MDLGIVKRAGRKPVVIGFLTFLFPVTLNLIVAGILSGKRELNPVLLKSIWHVAIFQAVTSFHVIVCLLADLKLVNSELGQLAISSSMISGMCSWGLVIVILFITELKHEPFWILLCPISLIVLIFYVLRPLMVKMIAKTPEGEQVKEGYVLSIFIMVLGTAFLSEVLGYHVVFGATALGIAVPHGPPLGTALENKIESFVSSILLPSYFVLSVSRVDLLSIHSETVFVISMFGLTSFIGKVLGGMLPALFFKVPPVEAFSLGLVMSCQGISDVLLVQHGHLTFLVDRQMYSMMVINMLFVSGTFTPLIKFLYDPSRHYKASNKRTIHHTSLNMEFRILAGMYHQDSTPCMIRLLEISNPTAKTPMCCYIVHLVQLVGSLSPLFMYHEPGATAKLPTKDCGRIINAFRLYEQESNGNVIVNLFTSISPFASIHEEVCRLAVEKRTSVVIIPFHMQWGFHGIEDITEARAVNRHILAKAPCSVGILVDRGTLSASKHHFVYKIGIIFVHGRDDREALAYGLRMAKHAKVSLTVIHLIDPAEGAVQSLDMDLDDDIITEFKAASAGKKRHSYITEFVKDSVELITVIRSVQNSYDLILVGRHHRSFSPIFMGLTEWNEFPELGFLGDVLASSDSQCQVSVLVVQQQVYRAGDRMNSAKNLLEDSAETVEIIFESTQGWKDIDISRHRMQPR
ncbi:cation/H(+) antiporter 15-like [Populus nigra]|uniref:cation/H(+) antiporter 15-like n=1 Tax=Populus nigra TaxID=3691 RepID=UPI002B2736DF|nr:cation/H(+) antiporter 15-like [Populus nigra]